MSRDSTAICLIGQVVVDVTLPQYGRPYKMRLGGVMHAARALWAAGFRYTLAFAAPGYLAEQAADYAIAHGALAATQFATVDGSPNVVLIGDVKEAGDQGYEFLLRNEHCCRVNELRLAELLSEAKVSDALIFAEGLDLGPVFEIARSANIPFHVDIGSGGGGWEYLEAQTEPIDSLIISTSSREFADRFDKSPEAFWNHALPRIANRALLKENRGGSRLARSGKSTTIDTPAFLGHTEHSVGVGDCFDALWIKLRRELPEDRALIYASLGAADYASTTFPDELRRNVAATLALPGEEVRHLKGIKLPWEKRPSVNIYVAAPDFDFVDRTPIDLVANALRYHNFSPRLPVRENGQMGLNPGVRRKSELLQADLRLLDQCQLMVAVVTYNDPGTLIEIGIACERGMPVIVFDVSGRAENLMLTELPTIVSSDIEEVIASVFEEAAR